MKRLLVPIVAFSLSAATAFAQATGGVTKDGGARSGGAKRLGANAVTPYPTAPSPSPPGSATGNIAAYSSNARRMTIKSAAVAAKEYPLTKETIFVDPTGKVLGPADIRPGQPATIYYKFSGDQLIVDKVVVGVA